MPLSTSDEHPVVAADTRGWNFYQADAALKSLLKLYLDSSLFRHIEPFLESLGSKAANDLDEHARLANANPPQLIYRDRFGRDLQRVEYHASYRKLEEAAFSEYEIHALSHRAGAMGWSKPMPLVAKHAFTYLFNQAEFGIGCPINVTDSTADLLIRFGSKELKDQFLPRLLTNEMSVLLQGAQFMTEQEGGSDVGKITTRAVEQDGEWKIFGEKWFCSNADAGVSALLARPEGAPSGTKGLALFLVPRELTKGVANRYRIIRLKEKLGTRSMASGEIAFEGATAYLIGDIDQGFRQMTQMMNGSRLSNGVKSAALMRRAVHDAHSVAKSRTVFGNSLYELPLARRQLLKIALPAEQSLSMWLFVASQLDRANSSSSKEASLASRVVRLATPVLKMRATRDARKVTSDAMEFRGGTGYTEEFVNARLVRDSHLGSIWEGTTNIVAIDAVRRAIARAQCLDAYHDVLTDLLNSSHLVDHQYRSGLESLLDRICKQAQFVAQNELEYAYRQVTSNLYHIATAILLLWESNETNNGSRMLWSQLVQRFRLAPIDPLQISGIPDPVVDHLLKGTPVSLAEARELLKNFS